MDFTCVEIKNVRYIKLLTLEKEGEKHLDLTTIHRDQELAYLNIYLVDRNKKKILLKSIKIDHVRPGNSGIPELNLTVKYDGRRYYRIILKLNGYINHNSVIDIKQYLTKKVPFVNIALITLALLIFSFLTFFAFNTFNSKDKSNSSDRLVYSNDNIGENSSNDSTDSFSSDNSSNSNNSSNDSTTNNSFIFDTSSTDTSFTDTSSTDTSSTSVNSRDTSSTVITSINIDEKYTVYFEPESAVLKKETRDKLYDILEKLKSYKEVDVSISGHTAFFGTEDGRQTVSYKRAVNVYTFLKENGWTPENDPQLSGWGLKKIITKDVDNQNLNRRVEISILSKNLSQ